MSDDDQGNQVVSGVSGLAPADLFENFSAGETQMLADASPFRNRPQPIGGSRKGIPNKRTTAMRELYLKSGFPHPLLWQGAMLREGVDGLAAKLECSLVEAAEILRKIASDAMPYLESKMPSHMAIASDGERLPVMIIGDVQVKGRAAVEARDDGAMAIDDDLAAAIIEDQQNQGLKDGEANASHGDPSHDKP